MGRGRKNYTLEEQLTITTDEIAKCEDNLKQLKEKKKELENAQEQEKLSQLYAVILKSGKTIDDVAQMLEE